MCLRINPLYFLDIKSFYNQCNLHSEVNSNLGKYVCLSKKLYRWLYKYLLMGLDTAINSRIQCVILPIFKAVSQNN